MTRRLGLVLLVTTLALQGCFGVVATGVVGSVIMFDDRRSTGTQVDDQGIETKAENLLAEKFSETHFNVVSFNRMVLVSGEAPTEEIKRQIGEAVAGLPNVRGIYNEMAVARVSALSSRSNDAYISSKVKARMVDSNRFNPNHIKVFTEAGTVFLMGLVTRKEADDATEITRTTTDVRRVVRLFEYYEPGKEPPKPAANIEQGPESRK